jgi:hypothetical protein
MHVASEVWGLRLGESALYEKVGRVCERRRGWMGILMMDLRL